MVARGTESNRVKAFRLNVATKIPKFPNDKNTLNSLVGAPLPTLLIHYTNWAIRYVSNRPRAVHVETSASSDARWLRLKPEIESFLEKVRKGEDLTPHLSLKVHTRGYTNASSAVGGQTDRWADKDFLLSVMGYHHFHLGLPTDRGGHITRNDEVIFARVSRHDFTAIAICNHSVFDILRTRTGDMTIERDRLWSLFESHSTNGLPPGTVYVPAMITTSGHSFHLVRLSQEYARVIRGIDPKLDDMSYVQEMYRLAQTPFPKRPKIEWHLSFLDLGVVDPSLNVFFVFKYGPN